LILIEPLDTRVGGIENFLVNLGVTSVGKADILRAPDANCVQADVHGVEHKTHSQQTSFPAFVGFPIFRTMVMIIRWVGRYERPGKVTWGFTGARPRLAINKQGNDQSCV